MACDGPERHREFKLGRELEHVIHLPRDMD